MLPNLKAALAERRMKQVDLAYELRIPASTLSEIVHERRRPAASIRDRIARRLDAEEKWLFSSHVQIPKPTSSRSEEEIVDAGNNGSS
jgi:transcriptional regulator with XRE-family HTH domain